jgi:glutaredoxin-like protein
MTELLNDEVKDQVRDIFADLSGPVHILFFGQEDDCQYCDDTHQLISEVVALSDKLQISTYDLGENADVAAQYNVDKAPGLVIAGQNGAGPIDYGIRYAGIPAGHEFTTLIHDILRVSSADSGLNEKTREFIKNLGEPLFLQVFVTPTCPHCPRAVLLAHQMAMESDLIQAEMVEATEFQELAAQYYVSGVPNTTINHGAGRVVGAVPEGHLVEELQGILAV